MSEQQSLADKNAVYIARIRAQAASNNKTNEFKSDFDNEPQKKINLFGDNTNNQVLKLDKTKVEKSKKKHKFVQLPDTGLTETQLLTQYEIKSDKIGSGAFANIKVVKEHQTGKHYALKYVETKKKSATDINAFKKEILFLYKLTNHPNVIRMYDFCESPLGLYMVLEYCNGGDVAQQLKKNKTFQETKVKHISKQVVAGLCYLHQYNIVHRDIKPDNLMYNNGIVKIIDFGMAADCSNTPLTDSCGTPHFAAPEVICARNYDMKVDMWSLGVCIFLFICGQYPFFEKTGNQQKLLEIIKRGKFSFVDQYFNQCHPLLKDLISKLLCLQVGQRLNAQQARKHQWFTAECLQNNRQQSVPLPGNQLKKNNRQQTAPVGNNNKFGRQSVPVRQMKNNSNNVNSGRQSTPFNNNNNNNNKFGRHSAPFNRMSNNNANNNKNKNKNNNMQQRSSNVVRQKATPFSQHNNTNNKNMNKNKNMNHNMNNQNMNNINNNQNMNTNNNNMNNINNNQNMNTNNKNNNQNMNNNKNNNMKQQRNNNFNFTKQKGQNNQQYMNIQKGNTNFNFTGNNKNIDRNNQGLQPNDMKQSDKNNTNQMNTQFEASNINNKNQMGLPIAQPFHIMQ